MENRSFDQMLGFSQIQGTDAVSGKPTKTDGLTRTEVNPLPSPKQGTIEISSPSKFVADADPGHEFINVREQLCGAGDGYSSPTPPAGSLDPSIKNTGFVSNFAGKYPSADWATPMKCFNPDQLPVLTTLAKEFAVCDRWFSSMPGPTWPNRFFVHAATAGGLDHSPSLAREIGEAYKFSNGTIFDLLESNRLDWAIYMGDEFPQALHLDGMVGKLDRFRPFEFFRSKLASGNFSKSYTFIEPDWHPFTHFKGGNSQHPLDDVARGESLIKEVYEAVRNSPIWESSLLIITYDEHGGFYDHVHPPTTVDPGDSATSPDNNQNGFNFRQLGVRVPAVVISPYVGRGVIDHRLYDHSSVPATIEELFGMTSLTQRDKQAARVNSLLTLKVPRTDAPQTLPAPANSGARFEAEAEVLGKLESDVANMAVRLGIKAPKPVDPALAGFVHVALLRKLSTSTAAERVGIIAEARAVQSDADAMLYLHRARKAA